MVVEIAEFYADRSFDNSIVLPFSWLADVQDSGLRLD